jgi:cytochrome c5
VVIAAGGPAHLRNVGDTSGNEADTLIAFSLSGTEPEAAPLVTRLAPVSAPPGTTAAIRAELPEAPGKRLVQLVCGQCHGVAVFAQNRMSREEWQVEVADMVARGATGTADELRAVVDYLATNLAGPAGTRRSRPPHRP